ncbi:MAG: HIG1 domain-containing protein [Rhodospirillaceae bacterium]|nr:HIG1 domain-containing protein [Rhodospirillaceae bacterium]
MSSFLLIVAILCGLGAVGSLLTGVIGLGRAEFNNKYGNKLMRARVGFQFAAVLFLFLYWLSLPK